MFAIKNLEHGEFNCGGTALPSRVWVVQELGLAPCVICFTPQQLIWEYAGFCANERAPDCTLKNHNGVKKRSLEHSPWIKVNFLIPGNVTMATTKHGQFSSKNTPIRS